MTALTIYPDNQPQQGELFTDFTAIQGHLKQIGVQFEQWASEQQLASDADQVAVLAAYETSINKLKVDCGFQSVDVMNLTPDHPDRAIFRQKFLAEHEHEDFEVRFFVEGRGLFYLHVNNKVFAVLCEQGDLISVPANTPHWFDMGENPKFTCIRLFTTPDGWVAKFTGSDLAKTFPNFDSYVASL